MTLELLLPDEQARRGGRALLAAALCDSRARTLALLDAYVEALGETLAVPYSTQVNPPLWEAGHIGWFQDFWIARNRSASAASPATPTIPARRAHGGSRCALQLQPRRPRHALGSCRCPTWRDPRLPRRQPGRNPGPAGRRRRNAMTALYFYRLALFHEDMHAEAATYMAQALDIALPAGCCATRRPCAENTPLALRRADAGRWAAGPGFAFDNELPAHKVGVGDFEIDSEVVNWARYLPSSKPPAPRRRATCAGRRAPGSAASSASGARWTPTRRPRT
jgi:iron(II)-dependent oxidoreductase